MKYTGIRNLHRGMGGLCRLLAFVAVFAGAAQSSFGADEEGGDPLVERFPPAPADQSAGQELPANPVGVRQSIANAAEPSTNGQFTVSRTGLTSLALAVNYTVSGTAIAAGIKVRA